MKKEKVETIYKIYVESEIGNDFACEETRWHFTETGAVHEMASLLMDSCLDAIQEIWRDYYENELDFESWLIEVVSGNLDADIYFTRSTAECVLTD